MVGKSDFTSEEWQSLMRAPVAAAAYVAQAGPTNPVQLVIERDAMAAAIGEGQAAPPESLVSAVVADMAAMAAQAETGAAAAAGMPGTPGAPGAPAAGAPQAQGVATPGAMPAPPPAGVAAPAGAAGQDTGIEIMPLLHAAAGAAGKAPAQDAEMYGRWVLYVAQRVALSAPEGEAFISGDNIVATGPAVSPAEAQAVAEVAGAFGINLAPGAAGDVR